MTGGTARYDEIADFYDATAGRSVTDVATAALLELAGEVRGLALLDVACGQGRVAREFARRGARVTGVDISAALLAKAAEAGKPFHEGWWLASNPGFRGKVGANHRTLSTYLNSLACHGFVLEQVAEPRPGADWQQRPPGAAPVPVHLVARCLRR